MKRPAQNHHFRSGSVPLADQVGGFDQTPEIGTRVVRRDCRLQRRSFRGSRVIVDQHGNFNGVAAVQQGYDNFTRVYQKHNHNNAMIQQYGDGNPSVTGQHVNWNSSTSFQRGYDNINGTAQIGSHNTAKTRQVGRDNAAGTIQIGDGIDASTNQNSNRNTSLFIQGN